MSYIQDNADNIYKELIEDKRVSMGISTCDYSNWDQDLHRAFPLIAEKLREKGLRVTSSVKWGVTDWVIVNPQA